MKIDYFGIVKKVSPYNIKKGILYLKHYGIREFWIKLTERFQKEDVDYRQWFEDHKVTQEEWEKQRKTVFGIRPVISILVPVYNTPVNFLMEMIESVRNQSYENWQLCIANASPDNQELSKVLKEQAGKDKRICITDVKENKGISENTNRALEIAEGDYVGFLDHDDVLALNALFEIVKKINEAGRADVIYTDEDKVSMDLTEHFSPNFKPDFNVDLLRSNNYICHFFVAGKAMVEKLGGLCPEYNGAQDYDLILRCTEQAEHILHVPKILYHWRTHKDSTADNPLSKSYAYEAGKKAIEAHLQRCGVKAEVEYTSSPGFYRVKYELEGNPLVSIVIPNKDNKECLEKCVHSIITKSTYKNFEVVIVENNSQTKEIFSYYKKIRSDRIRIVTWKGEFNYSAINNFGVSHCKGDYIVLLNNDTEVISEDWLEEMVGHCQRQEVGIVGAKLYYPDNTVQHAGIIVGIGGVAGNVFVGLPRAYSGYMHKASLQLDLSAVTAACLMVKKTVYDEVGGLEEKLKVAFNDVDFCLRVRKAGYLVVYDPYVEFYHYESKTRGAEDTPEKIRRFQSEIEYMRSHWIDILKNGDPAYNPNLTLKKWDYSLKADARKR